MCIRDSDFIDICETKFFLTFYVLNIDHENLVISTTEPYVSAKINEILVNKVIPAKHSLCTKHFIRKNEIKNEFYENDG